MSLACPMSVAAHPPGRQRGALSELVLSVRCKYLKHTHLGHLGTEMKGVLNSIIPGSDDVMCHE